MACVVGLIDNGKVILGCDTIATTSEGDIRPVIADKIIRYQKPHMLIGWAGDIRPGQTLRPHFFTPPKEILDLPDAMRNQFEKYGCLHLDDSGPQITKCNFLIAYEDRLYEILLDFQLNEIKGNFTAVGAGAPYAFGSLFTSKDLDITPEDKLELALNAACEYSATCYPPFSFEEL